MRTPKDMSCAGPSQAEDAIMPRAEVMSFGVLPGPYSDPELMVLGEALRQLPPGSPEQVDLAEVLGFLAARAVWAADAHAPVIGFASGVVAEVDARDRFAQMLCQGFLAEAEQFQLFCTLVQPGFTVVDVGANFGLYTLHAARRVGETGRVFSFEAGADIFSRLTRNIERNGVADRVCAMPRAVGNTNGERQFYVAESGSFSGLKDTGRSPITAQETIRCVRLDECAELAGISVDILKIDVEGGELDVLSGAADLIGRSPDIILQVECQPKNMSEADLLSLYDWVNARLADGFVLHEAGTEGRSSPVDPEEQILPVDVMIYRRNSVAARRVAEASRVLLDQNGAAGSLVDPEHLARILARRLRAEIRKGTPKEPFEERLERLQAEEKKLRELLALEKEGRARDFQTLNAAHKAARLEDAKALKELRELLALEKEGRARDFQTLNAAHKAARLEDAKALKELRELLALEKAGRHRDFITQRDKFEAEIVAKDHEMRQLLERSSGVAGA